MLFRSKDYTVQYLSLNHSIWELKHYVNFWDCTAAYFPPEKWETTKKTQSSQDYLLNLKWIWLNWNKVHQCSNTQGLVFHGEVISALNGPVFFCERISFAPGLLITHVCNNYYTHLWITWWSWDPGLKLSLQRQERSWQLKISLFKIQKIKY